MRPRARPAALAATIAVELVVVLSGLACGTTDRHDPLPPLYLGVDSYLHWDKLPYLEIGDRVAGQSTADPVGSNNDSINVLATRPGGGRVLFDQVGPGVVTFMRMQEVFGEPWRLTADGQTRNIAGTDLGGAPGNVVAKLVDVVGDAPVRLVPAQLMRQLDFDRALHRCDSVRERRAFQAMG